MKLRNVPSAAKRKSEKKQNWRVGKKPRCRARKIPLGEVCSAPGKNHSAFFEGMQEALACPKSFSLPQKF